MSVTVLLVEDHALVRAGIRALLDNAMGIDVIGEARDGREALNSMRTQPADVVVMDITMPGLNGLETTKRLKKAHPRTRVLILSMYSSDEYVVQSMRYGADGYLVKDSAAPELEKAIHTVARGERYLSDGAIRERLEHQINTARGMRDPLERLTPRQREILQLVVEGKKTREIAELLNVSVKTVETHRAQLMDRLGIHDVAGLVRYAIRNGLISSYA
ncbi:MAG: response regulator transcription factor [Pseudomonadota bacterium]